MKILLDIGHPAHVHYFRNFIRIMESKGHVFQITARDKEVTFDLLNKYRIPFISRGTGKKGLIGKILYVFQGDWVVLKVALKFKPDLFLSFGSTYPSHVAFLLRKPHITYDDTEHAVLEHIMCFPFCSVILTPESYLKDLGKKQIRFSGFIELCSLHPKYYKPDVSVLEMLGLSAGEKFILIRFVSWQASHDFQIKRIDINKKIELVKELSKYIKVFISSEGEIPSQLEKYRLRISPEKMHDVLSLATLYIGEGATMASECAMLGTPAIYVNELDAGTLREQAGYDLILNLRNSDSLIKKAVDLLHKNNLKEEWNERYKKMLEEKIDVTAFMVWFVENYPFSFATMKANPEYQDTFKVQTTVNSRVHLVEE